MIVTIENDPAITPFMMALPFSKEIIYIKVPIKCTTEISKVTISILGSISRIGNKYTPGKNIRSEAVLKMRKKDNFAPIFLAVNPKNISPVAQNVAVINANSKLIG